MPRVTRHLFAFCSAVIVLGGVTGCASKLAARGEFVGQVLAVPVQTMEREDHTVYLIRIERGPAFTDPDTKVHGSHVLFPSAGELAVLTADRRGNAYRLPPRLVGHTVRVTGVMRISGRTLVNGRELRRSPELDTPYKTDFGLEVRRITWAD